MAVQIHHVQASNIKALEKKVNVLLAEITVDARNIVEVIAVFADREQGQDNYVAVVQHSAPHLRTFEGDDEHP